MTPRTWKKRVKQRETDLYISKKIVVVENTDMTSFSLYPYIIMYQNVM